MLKIITDSSTLYTVEEANKLGFESVLLNVSIGDLEGRDLQVDMKEFYERIKIGEIPRSSQPSIGEVMDVFEKYNESEILNISMADGLSGTYQSACGAKEMVENGERITVFNTKTLCGPHRYMVEKAQKMKEAGHSLKEILAWLEDVAERTESFLIPQDFAFLKRGGRLTPMAATLGSVLKLKPIMTLTKDCKKLDKFAVKRTMKAAVKSIIDHMKEKGVDDRYKFYVVHADALEDAKGIVANLKEVFGNIDVELHDLSPVFVTQGGPQCIAIQYIEKV